jgi:hypothetical protein
MENRQGAYQEAGLGAATPIGTPPLDAPATAAAPLPPAGPAPASPASASVAATAPAPASVPSPADSATSSWSATSAKSAAEASVPNLSAASGNYASLSTPDAPTLSAVPQGDAAPAPAVNPLSGVGTAIGNAGTAVTGFFGNMFGGGSTATTAPSADVATAAAPPAAPAPSVQAPPVVSDWNSGVSVLPAGSEKPAKAEVKKKVAAVEKPRATAAGKYRLQVGIVSSREEAENITARLRAEHATNLGAAAPAIDEVTFGNGTFYRVQVGPYASAAEPGQFCSALKPKGYDCLVVTK